MSTFTHTEMPLSLKFENIIIAFWHLSFFWFQTLEIS